MAKRDEKKAGGSGPMDPDQWTRLQEAAECLRTLAHPVRIQMVRLLLKGKYTVGELASACQVPPNVASEHLRLLQRCGFLSSRRAGRTVFYQVAEPHLKPLVACIEKKFLAR